MLGFDEGQERVEYHLFLPQLYVGGVRGRTSEQIRSHSHLTQESGLEVVEIRAEAYL